VCPTQVDGVHSQKGKESCVLAFIRNIGGPEILVILVVVMFFFGAKKLPELARSIGASTREFKKGIEEGADEDETQPEDTTV
jgi:sec-independent protein translocase protein TatA